MTDELYEKRLEQLAREQECAEAGYQKLLKGETDRSKASQGSSTLFGITAQRQFLEDIVVEMNKVLEDLYSVRSGRLSKAIKQCIKVNNKGKAHQWFNYDKAALIGFNETINTALNTNISKGKTIGRTGGDKNLLQKMELSKLEEKIGSEVNRQIHLEIIKHTFPEYFRSADKFARKSSKDGNRASNSQWNKRMSISIKQLAEDLYNKGDIEAAELVEDKGPWTYEERRHIGAWIVASITAATGLFEVKSAFRASNKQSNELCLSEAAEKYKKELMEYAIQHAMIALPMLIEPEPVTEDSMGGWLTSCLNPPNSSVNGEIKLSGKHYEFINRQARVPFQINPFNKALLEKLVELELPLGKFKYKTYHELPSLAQLLGHDGVIDEVERDRLIRSNPDFKAVKRELSNLKDIQQKQIDDGWLGLWTLSIAEKVSGDERNYIPVHHDFRGRIYPQVPFLSFQSNDVGKYLIRFANKTPIDDRTDFWMKIGISNGCGNDKLSWDKRLIWFEQYKDEIINVGRMMEEKGDFSRAYEFLTQDFVDDPFCVAAIANEYVKVFVDKVQTYTQVYVTVDCSCSGTSIFNSWRRNLSAARLTNVVPTEEPQDIYMEVWRRMKELAKPGTFRPAHIHKLENSKLLRKMMKEAYIPASYASSKSEQHKKLKQFNYTTLTDASLKFKDDEMDSFLKLWSIALDEVSSISTVVNWFRDRTEDALDNGATRIDYTTVNGSVMTQLYPKQESVRFDTFNYGSGIKRRQTSLKRNIEGAKGGVNRTEMLNAVTANITHATDAAALCETFWNYQGDFIAIHDAAGFPPSKLLDEGLDRLKDGFIKATSHNVWEQFCLDNNLAIDPATPAPIIGDLDLELIRKSNYLYS